MNFNNKHAPNPHYLRTRKKEGVSVETNTEPWLPQCRMCVEREKSSQFVFSNNIDVNEYVRAINYINSIHGIINESLSLNSGDSSTSLKPNVSMPDLPNFLTILSSICNTNRNSSISCNNMISRTTSTSSLCNVTTPVNDTSEIQNEDIQSPKPASEISLLSYNNQNNQENLLNVKRSLLQINQEGFLQINPDQDENTIKCSNEQQTGNEPFITDLQFQNMDPLEHLETVTKSQSHYKLGQSTNHDNICKRCASSTSKIYIKKQSTVGIQTNRPRPKSIHRENQENRQPSNENPKPSRPKSRDASKSNKRRSTSRSKSVRDLSISSKEDKCRMNQRTSNPKKDKHNLILSEADLDQFTSVLLRGRTKVACDSSPNITELAGTSARQAPKDSFLEPSKSRKSRGQNANTEPIRKRLMQKIKDLAPQPRGDRSTSPKTKSYESSASSTVSKPQSSRCAQSAPLAKRNLTVRPFLHSNMECPLSGDEGLDDNSSRQHYNSLAAPNSHLLLHFQLPSLTKVRPNPKSKLDPRNLLGSNYIPNTASLPNQTMLTFMAPKRKKCKTLKKCSTYSVQENKGDEPRKNYKHRLRRRSSDSLILTDKEDSPVNYTDSDIADDIEQDKSKIAKVPRNHQKQRKLPQKQKNLQGLFVPGITNERIVISAPLQSKREARNKLFRQTRKKNENDEVLDITRRMSHQKCRQFSDNNSNVSRTTASSDIKSDRELSPRIFERRSKASLPKRSTLSSAQLT